MAEPWEEMSKIWQFLDARKPDKKFREALQDEMSTNPDKDWQKEKSGDLAQYIPKSQQGSWKTYLQQR